MGRILKGRYKILEIIYAHPESEMVTEIDKSISKECTDDLTMKYLQDFKVAGNMLYECRTLSVWGTEYRVGQYVLIQGSTIDVPVFCIISKLLCCQKCAYLMLQKTSSVYCNKTDLYFISDESDYEVMPIEHLAAFHPLESYLVSEGQKISISLRFHSYIT